MKYLSLCMPTNGVVEWVFPVLDSIYSQGIDCKLFEVVITDNGKNSEFKKKLQEYMSDKENIIYAETNATAFINEIEAYNKATGHLIKFVNHRTCLVEGALEKLISFAEKNYIDKPIIYFSNGVLKKDKGQFAYESFDQFVNNLSYWSSWSTGMTLWKVDFEFIAKNTKTINELFPHTEFLFGIRNRKNYIIDNSVVFHEIPPGKKPKGDYDLFFAFGVVYPSIVLKLYEDKSISIQTYHKIINDNLDFIAQLYFDFVVIKNYCSYDLSGINNIFGVFYTEKELKRKVFSLKVRRLKGIIFSIFKR